MMYVTAEMKVNGILSSKSERKILNKKVAKDHFPVFVVNDYLSPLFHFFPLSLFFLKICV